MLSSRLTAMFFTPREAAGPGLAELAALAGVRELRSPPDADSAAFGAWDGLRYAEVELLELSDHRCLVIAASLSEFQAMREAHRAGQPLPLEADGALPVAYAFLAACSRLGAEVGVMLTHRGEDGREWVDANYWMVLGMDANALADARPGLLFLNPRVASGWVSTPARDRRDRLPADQGLLVFADEGWARWY